MIQFFQTIMGKQFYDNTMPRLARAIEALNQTVGGLNARLDWNQENDKRFIAQAEQARVENQEGLELLKELVALKEKMEKIIELHTSPLVTIDGQPKLYDEEGKELVGPAEDAPLPWEVVPDPMFEAKVLASPKPGEKSRVIVSSGSARTCNFVAQQANSWKGNTKAEAILHEVSDALTAAVDEQDARSMARRLQEILWPGGDEEFEWDSEKLDEVGNTLREYGYGPEAKEQKK